MAGRDRKPMTSGVGMAGSSNILNGGSECNVCPYKDRRLVITCAECWENSWATPSSPDDCPKKEAK